MWASWVHHSWRFEHAEAPRKVSPEMPERGSKTSTMPVVWATFGISRHDPNDLLSWLVTMDETWLYHYDLETKQQSMEWCHRGSPRPKKFQVPKSAGRVLASIFWDQDSILLIDYLSKGQTINAEFYSSLLVQLKDILKEKHCGKFTKGVLFLHDNAYHSPGTCNPEETGLPGLPVSWSPTLFSGCGPVGLPPVPWTEKTIER